MVSVVVADQYFRRLDQKRSSPVINVRKRSAFEVILNLLRLHTLHLRLFLPDNSNMIFPPDFVSVDLGNMKSEYSMHFNTLENVNIAKKKKDAGDGFDGPIADKICRKCGHNQMSYAAMQLRSADEGQTVFFTCVKCK